MPISETIAAASRYRSVHFLNSVNAFSQLPPDAGREVAFAGRSNAGKSSALNVLTGQRQLARVSKTPGRTQLLNFFTVEPERYLVDLPGYGYARVPDAIRRHWQALLERYLRERTALRGLLLLMDIRHPLTVMDRQLLETCAYRHLPVHILLTKADKLSRGAAQTALRPVQATLGTDYPQASAQLFSALNGQGVAEVHARLDEWLGYPRA
jgi:GTP-binding protein